MAVTEWVAAICFIDEWQLYPLFYNYFLNDVVGFDNIEAFGQIVYMVCAASNGYGLRHAICADN